MHHSAPIVAAPALPAFPPFMRSSAECRPASQSPTLRTQAERLAENEGSIAIAELDVMISTAASLPSFVLDPLGLDDDDCIANPAYSAAWAKVEAFAVVVAQTRAIDIVRARGQNDVVGRLILNAGRRSAA